MGAAHIVKSAIESVAAEQLAEASFDFYGTGLTVVSEVSSLVDSLAKDFAYFAGPSQRGAEHHSRSNRQHDHAQCDQL